MKKTLITTLKIIIPLGIGVYLTWFFIANLTAAEFDNLEGAFLKANYSYLFYGIIILLLSHMSRAYRWKYMLAPLGHEPNFWKMYHSVMIGYLINLTIPRSGEVARAAYYSKFQKNAPFNKVFGTIIVERVIDMLMLGMVFTVAAFLQKDVAGFNNIKNAGKSDASIPGWIYFAVLGAVIAGVIVILASTTVKIRVIELIKGVWEGVRTIFQLKQRVAYIAHTFFIWFCYIFMIWVCSFALPETSNLTINAVFAAFVVGAIAISATPGGIGLYPLMVSAVLTNLYHVQNSESFSLLAWAALTVFTIVLGLISLFALPFISKKQE